MKTKKRPAFGDRLWRVEWVSKLAFYEGSEDIDRDECTTRTRCFKTWEEAKAFAEATWPSTTDKFGLVQVDEIEFQSHEDEQFPWWGHWVEVDEFSKIFSGEWES